MCRIDDIDDYAAIWRNEVRHARKPYRCAECGREIAKGETYRSSAALQEGHWDTWRTCSHCMIAQDWLVKQCGGWVCEMVGEEIDEHIAEYPRIALPLMRISVGMSRKWKRFDGTGLMKTPAMPPAIQLG